VLINKILIPFAVATHVFMAWYFVQQAQEQL